MSLPKRIVLIGATGVFGRALAQGLCGLAQAEMVLTSRSLVKAQALASSLDAQAAAFDTRDDAGAFFALWQPWLVIDASGPFQGAGYGLPRAALLAGAHWFDIADARDYILGFAAGLDVQARTAGRVALTGASTTPALSGAVVRALTRDWQRLDTIDTAVLPGGSSLVGASVLAAVLSRAGVLVPAFAAGRATMMHGWCSARRVDLPGVGKRWASSVEAADPELFAPGFCVRNSVHFSAGLENRLEHFGLMALALLRRFGIVRHPEKLAGLLERLRRVTARFGRTTGGMTVTVSGLDAQGRWCKRRWTLLAHKGQGPHVPVLPALALARQLLRGAALQPGARPAHAALELGAYEAEMAPFAMETRAETLATLDRSLFETILGRDFGTLPEAVRHFHAADSPPVWQGRARVVRGSSLLAKLVARCVGFAASDFDVPVTVTIERDVHGEVWTRDFGGQRFASHLRLTDGKLRERFGALDFAIGLTGGATGIAMPVAGWRCLGLPLSRWLAPRSQAFETQDAQGCFAFDVRLTLPFGLLLAHYQGWLKPAR